MRPWLNYEVHVARNFLESYHERFLLISNASTLSRALSKVH